MQCLNLDAMTDNELFNVQQTHTNRSYKRYAWNKRVAMTARFCGLIEIASKYEKICDDIYFGLPSNLKW